MVQVIGSIENMNTTVPAETLPHVQSEEFDGLIDKINAMLISLETKNSELRSAELRAKNAEIGQQKALVFSLKKQINAHFTINTLNTVRLLVERGNLEKAGDVAMGLTSLIRYAYDKDELINVWDEFEILQKYIAIMNSRYDNKFNVDFDFDDRLMDYSIPRMLLQPILENAITHGFKNMDAGCKVSVKAELCDNSISFQIKDNGCGMSEEALNLLSERLSTGSELERGYENIALQNIKNRIYYYYGGAGQIQIRSNAGGGIEVSISIPSITKEGGTI
jgi:sensor histidine kinase YesM